MEKHKINNEGLTLELPIRMESILEMEYEQTFGEHATITIKGILSCKESVKKVYSMGMEDTIVLKQEKHLRPYPSIRIIHTRSVTD